MKVALTPDSTKPVKRRDLQTWRCIEVVKVILAAFFLASMIACQGTMPQKDSDSLAMPDTDLPPSQRVQNAIKALQQGQTETARSQLTWALQEKPSLKVAKDLLDQLDTDPIEYLGEEHFTYRIEAGDSLSVIARDYLDDPLKFVILARYNEIQIPSELVTGQLIKIPGKKRQVAALEKRQGSSRKPATAADLDDNRELKPLPGLKRGDSQQNSVSDSPDHAVPAAEGTGKDLLSGARGTRPARLQNANDLSRKAGALYANGDLSGAIDLLQQAEPDTLRSEPVRGQLLGYYREWVDRAVATGDLDDAMLVTGRAILLDPSNKRWIDKRNSLERNIEAQRLFQEGQNLLNEQKLAQAYDVFSQAQALDPTNSTISSAQERTRLSLLDSYHRQALLHFRKHDLNGAIEYWDKILVLDPQNNLALGYRARAVELNTKLEKLSQ